MVSAVIGYRSVPNYDRVTCGDGHIGTGPVTKHYRNGRWIGTTECKRQHDFHCETTDIDAGKRRLKCFHKLVSKGYHDMACYIYLFKRRNS